MRLALSKIVWKFFVSEPLFFYRPSIGFYGLFVSFHGKRYASEKRSFIRRTTVLSSTISPTQTQWDFLAVLVDAIRRYGTPEALVTDGGGQFYSNMALELYEMLDIRKERIDPGEPWENYAETLFSVQRRMADHAFSNARTWPEIQEAHQTWWKNYNAEDHYAHRKRQDGRHSPSAVLRGRLGRTYPEEVLSRVLYATQFTRRLDAHGYANFKNWRFFGEDGLAGEQVSIRMYEGTLKLEYQATTLSQYSVALQPDHKHIAEVKRSHRFETYFRSPQLHLWQLSDTEWLLALRRPEPGPPQETGEAGSSCATTPVAFVWHHRMSRE